MKATDLCTGENCDLKLICQRYIDYEHADRTNQEIIYDVVRKSSKSCKDYKHKVFYGG